MDIQRTDVHRIDGSVMPEQVVDERKELCERLLASPIPPAELIRNLGLYLLPMEVKRLLFFADLYQRIVSVPGIIVEFGCRWGQNLAHLQSLRSILEPYHHRRMILGFDTFEGFPSVSRSDGDSSVIAPGAYSVTPGYETYLHDLLALRERQSALPNVRKFKVIQGNAPDAFQAWLDEHPETIVALAYFDMDLYEPTAQCLRLLKGRLTQGSIVGFDELNHSTFPGETMAVREVLGLDSIRLRRSLWSADECFFEV